MDEVKITGIEQQTYFINNDIWVEIISTNDQEVEMCDVFPKSLTLNKDYKEIRLYAHQGKIRVNLSPMIKGYFNEPKHNEDYTSDEILTNSNWDKFNLKFVIKKTNTITTIELDKIFIRGGLRTTQTNLSIAFEQALRPTEKVAYWEEYPIAEYVLKERGIVKINRDRISKSNLEKKTYSGCNPVYVKFLNSLGGYSYWLFDKQTNTQTNKNIGVLTSNGAIRDLGNDTQYSIELSGKVTTYYMPLILDLAISSEIYMYLKEYNQWERISSMDNTIQTNNFLKGYPIKLNFKKHYKYNTQITW